MELALQENIDDVINDFINKHTQGIKTIHRLYLKTDNELSVRAFTAEVFEELKKGYVTFVSKGYPLEELDPYLFYIVNSIGKSKNLPIESKNKSDYLCPGCLFLGKENVLTFHKTFNCDLCFYEFKRAKEPFWISFYETFKVHNKSGFKCPDCDRFIPQPLDGSTEIVCPYISCFFVGEVSTLKSMHHPSSKSKLEIYSLDLSKNNLSSHEASSLDKLQIREDLESKVKIISDAIDGMMYSLPFKNQNLVSKHKALICQAIKNILSSDPIDTVSYLLDNSRSGGFQHRIFQEYIKLLEESFPLFYQEKNKQSKIESLLDERLGIFEGISTFNGVVNEHATIKNNTQEFYIGGRKAAYAKPYYIGKLLNVLLEDNNLPVMNLVSNYTFSKIKINGLKTGTKVIVSHLRIPPHYQMGGMTYVNRVRKHIVDKSKILIKNNV